MGHFGSYRQTNYSVIPVGGQVGPGGKAAPLSGREAGGSSELYIDVPNTSHSKKETAKMDAASCSTEQEKMPRTVLT